jgi:hypothetical protein
MKKRAVEVTRFVPMLQEYPILDLSFSDIRRLQNQKSKRRSAGGQ